jgi:hypothetical protein
MLNVSVDTVKQAKVVLERTAPEVVQAVDAGQLAVSAAVPLAALPKAAQPAALREALALAEQEAKKPTATVVKTVVNKAQVVATVQAERAAGKTPAAAVQAAVATPGVGRPTPSLAEAGARVTDRRGILAATDGPQHDGPTKAAAAESAAWQRRLCGFCDALETLATLQGVEGLAQDLPPSYASRVHAHLAAAVVTLNHFAALWKDAQHPEWRESAAGREEGADHGHD